MPARRGKGEAAETLGRRRGGLRRAGGEKFGCARAGRPTCQPVETVTHQASGYQIQLKP